jgi:predicted nucleic acid-binding protein
MYLLDTQPLMDVLSRDHSRRVFDWIDMARPQESDLFVSVISLAQIAHFIEGMETSKRNQWRRLLQEGRNEFETRGSVVNVDAAIVDVWQASLRGDNLAAVEGAAEELGEDDRLIIATALARGFTFVTPESEIIDAIAERTALATITP